MSDKNNKVKYNLKNAHYALLTVERTGRCPMQRRCRFRRCITVPGCQREPENFYADGTYYVIINMGW